MNQVNVSVHQRRERRLISDRTALCVLAWIDTAPAFKWRQGENLGNLKTWRRLSANLAHPWSTISVAQICVLPVDITRLDRRFERAWRTLYIEPGSPWENGYNVLKQPSGRTNNNESFNSKLRDELLNGKIFTTLHEAQVLRALAAPLQCALPALIAWLLTSGTGNNLAASLQPVLRSGQIKHRPMSAWV